MSAKSRGYTLIVTLLCAFALIMYGAYSPARKAQKQQIVCVKFKNGVKNEAVERHMSAFAALKHEIPQIVGYASGKTITPTDGAADYDVMHYLTFQSEDDIKVFEQTKVYQDFVKAHQNIWDKTLVINADIRQ